MQGEYYALHDRLATMRGVVSTPLFGLRYMDAGVPVVLIQISGSSRLRLKRGERTWWGAPPKGVNWEVFESANGHLFSSIFEAEKTKENILAP
jgi:hypothetical protein